LEQAIAEANGDLAGATRRLESLRLPDNEMQVLHLELAKKFTAEKLNELPGVLKEIARAERRSLFLEFVASVWERADPTTFLNFALEKLQGKDLGQACHTAIQGLFRRGKFSEAGEYIEKMPFSNFRSSAITIMAQQYGAQQLDAALHWAKSLPLPEDQLAAAGQLIPLVRSEQGATGLTELANQYADPQFQRKCVEQAVAAMAANGDFEAATTWITTLPPAFKETAEIQLIRMTAGRDVDAWTKYTLAHSSPNVRSQGIFALADQMFARGPMPAVEWANTLPNDSRDRAIWRIAQEWYDTDSIALSRWMNELPNGSVKDRVLETVARKLAMTDHASAKEVALRISNPNRLQAVIRDLDSQRPR
jgi:hypothetical protein